MAKQAKKIGKRVKAKAAASRPGSAGKAAGADKKKRASKPRTDRPSARKKAPVKKAPAKKTPVDARTAGAITGDALDFKLLGCSDEAVTKATGRNWNEWIAVLDRFDVKTNGHAAASEHLHGKHGCPGWWSQMVVVGYERLRGLRRVREQASGFSASASRTFDATADRVFDYFDDAAKAVRWLPEGVQVHKTTRPRSARMAWTDGSKVLSVWIGEKPAAGGAAGGGSKKTTVQVQHDRLPDDDACERMKRMWAERLEVLKGLVGG